MRQNTNEVKFNRLSAAKLFDVRASGLKFRVQHAEVVGLHNNDSVSPS